MTALEQSPKYKLDRENLWKIGRLLMITLCGTTLTFLVDLFPNVEFGDLTPFISVLFSGLIELGRKFLTDYSQKYNIDDLIKANQPILN